MLGDWLISIFRNDGIEEWLNKTPFGAESLNKYGSLAAQESAWLSLVGIKEI